MTDQDVDVLCFYVSELPIEELRMLEYTKIFPGLRLAGVTHCDAITAIRSTLKVISTLDKRREDVAWIYCWLIPRGWLHYWVLYRFNGSTAEAKDFTLHAKIANAFCSSGLSNAFVALGCERGRYACFMTREPESGMEEHCVICLCAWIDMPYLAVRVAGVHDLPKLRSVLKTSLKGELDKLMIGCFQELSSAFASALRDFNMQRAMRPAI